MKKIEFINREPDLQSGEYEFIGEYMGSNTKTLFKHNKCGNEWKTVPNSFHRGYRCPKCAIKKRGKNRRLTKEEFINREPDLLSGEYEFIGEYISSIKKTLFKHNVCGYEWNVVPVNFRRGNRCTKCTVKKMGEKRRLTKTEFVNREPDLLSGEYEFIGGYIGSSIKTLFKHNKCGYEWNVRPCRFASGTRCPKCAGVERITKEEFCERERDIKSGKYEFVGEYVNAHTKTLFKHNKCGYKWNVRPDSFRSGIRCPKCASTARRIAKEEFIARETDLRSGEYEFIGEYTNTSTKVLLKHNKCGYEWNIRPQDFHQGIRCPKSANRILTKEEFIARESDLLSGEYEFVGEYMGSSLNTLFKHSTCGLEWKVRPNSFQQGNRCPKCVGNMKLNG